MDLNIGDKVMLPSKSGSTVWVLDSSVSIAGDGTGRKFAALVTPDGKAVRLGWVDDMVRVLWSETMKKFVTVPEDEAPVDEVLVAALSTAHQTAVTLLDELGAKVGGLANVEYPNWGHVGDLNYVISQLKNALGQE